MRLSLASLLFLMISACETSAPPSTVENPGAWNVTKGRPQLLSGELKRGSGSKEALARSYLAEQAARFHLDAPGRSLRLSTTREGLAGTYLRFAQYQLVPERSQGTLPKASAAENATINADLRVWDGDVIVLVNQDVVRAVNLELRDEAHLAVWPDQQPSLIEASQRARELLSLSEGADVAHERVVHVSKTGEARVAWKFTASTETPPHDWSLLLDVGTLNELERRDGVKFIDGTGYVFDVNPVASTGDLTLTDSMNQATPALDAARFQVTLPRLDGSGFTRGDFADVRTRDGGARATSPTNEFLFSRNNLGFEQANVYFHLTRTQERIQALGFIDVNNRMQGAVVDQQNADNSFYSPQTLRLGFGIGGVDDAEDGDIVMHEYGHAIQDNQVPGWGGGDEDAMGEGFGDYLAASFSLVLAPDAGHPQLSDPACVGDWDAVAYSNETPPCLRRVDNVKRWPEDAEYASHADGEIWSASLWRARSLFGADVVDRLVLESHFILGTGGSMFTASEAILNANTMLDGGADETVLRRTLISYGVSRRLSAPGTGNVSSSIPVSIGPVRDATGNYRNATDETRTLTVPGASGLRLHFDRVVLETSNDCVANSCDNIYLFTPSGDLFQVITGVQNAGLTSVIVPGDTVQVRLISDQTQVRFGYRIDRIDVIGDVLDAGLVFDGGMDPFMPPMDAGVPDAGRPDAGVVDAGVMFDAGIPGPSARTLPAAGEETLTPTVRRGCGCGGGEAALMLPLLLVWFGARRRKS